jgi:hypothetical protein
MSTFKERMQPVIDGLPAGDDKDTLVALIATHDAMEQSGFNRSRSARAMRQYLRQCTHKEAGDHSRRPQGAFPGKAPGAQQNTP